MIDGSSVAGSSVSIASYSTATYCQHTSSELRHINGGDVQWYMLCVQYFRDLAVWPKIIEDGICSC